MNGQNGYEYDVMISWTGKDRALKNAVRDALKGAGLAVYDSETDCAGRFRDDYVRAIGASKVFLALMSDNLRSDPNVGGEGTFTEVRKEYEFALDADARGRLNIQIFNVSPDFRTKSVWDLPFDDVIGRYFAIFAASSGFSRIDAELADGAVPQDKLCELCEKVKTLVQRRDEGKPVPAQYVHFEVAETEIYGCDTFVGREAEIEGIAAAFRGGARAVVLAGMGGIGKSELAKRFALRYNKENVAAVQFVSLPDTFRAPETIKDRLFSVLNNIQYVRSVTERMAGEDDGERFAVMRAALQTLPPHALIILDNVNFPYRGMLKELLSFTKCLFLVTSRVVEREHERAAQPCPIAVLPEVTRLPQKEAHELFVRESGRNVSSLEFYELYRLVDGHTICLYLLARVLRTNPHKKIADIAEEFSENRMQESVRLLHNGNEKNATLLAHVEALFNLSALGEGCERILRGMSLLDDGKLSPDELREAFGLDNNNEIVALCEGGWLREGGGMLYLHPVLSRLAAWKLRPSAAKDGGMIAWLLQRAQNAEQLPVGGAVRLENGLYYALLVLARGGHLLCRPLWERFTELNHRHAAQAEVRERAEELLPLLKDAAEKAAVLSYADMVLVEQDPSRADVLAAYLERLEGFAGDYKWVSRMLPEVLPLALDCPRQRGAAARCIRAALAAAMAEKDDAAVLSLGMFLLFLEKERGWKKTILPYVRARKREGAEGGALLYMETLAAGLRFYPQDAFASFGHFAEVVSANMRLCCGSAEKEDAALCPDFAAWWRHPLRSVLRHPLFFLRTFRLHKRMERAAADGSDPMLGVFYRLNELEKAAVNGEYFDVEVFYEALLEAAGYFCVQKLLPGDPRQRALGEMALLLRVLPPEARLALFDYARPRALGEDGQPSLDDLSSMQMFFLICDSFDGADKEVLQEEYEVKQAHLRALRFLYAKDDCRVLNARWDLFLLSERLKGSADPNECTAIVLQVLRSGGRADLLRRAGIKWLSFKPSKKSGMTLSGFESAERAARLLVSDLWEAEGGLFWRAYALQQYADYVLAARGACPAKPQLPAAALGWMEEKARALAEALSPQSSPKDVDMVYGAWHWCWCLLWKQPASKDRRARSNKFLDVLHLLEVRAPQAKRWEMRVGLLFAQGIVMNAAGDLLRARALFCGGLKLACRKGVFRVGSMQNFREALLCRVLSNAKWIVSRDASFPPLSWADPLLSRGGRRRAKRLLGAAVTACLERSRVQGGWAPSDEAEIRKAAERDLLSVFEDLAYTARAGRGTPFGLPPKTYWRCRSVKKYVFAFLEYACKEFGEKATITVKKPNGQEKA